ncbi:MAG: helix-turn-helix transcriptional regulator [Cyanobacteriota bacterium]|nr:helix-turn-helix transcriptional regulator [Cyanobacteriota bacterium]
MNDKELLKTFGFNIKIERMKQKISQENLAEILNFSSVYISNVESGKHNISLTNALKFCNYFKKPVEYFIKEKV